jgi:hypothetical protein
LPLSDQVCFDWILLSKLSGVRSKGGRSRCAAADMAPPRLGLIELGAIDRRHVEAIQKSADCELVGIAADSDRRREQGDTR